MSVYYVRVENKRIKKLKLELVRDMSLANSNKYANIIDQLETICIDFAPLPSFECAIQYFSEIFSPKNS